MDNNPKNEEELNKEETGQNFPNSEEEKESLEELREVMKKIEKMSKKQPQKDNANNTGKDIQAKKVAPSDKASKQRYYATS